MIIIPFLNSGSQTQMVASGHEKTLLTLLTLREAQSVEAGGRLGAAGRSTRWG